MADLIIERDGRTTIFTLNRPESRNTLGGTLMADLSEGLRAFNADPGQSVAIITGAGDKAFCAGGDLKAMAGNIDGGRRLPLSPQPDICGVAASEKPVIAALNGLAVAGGFELALCCDIRMASTSAWFGLFEAKWGILAGVAVNVLPRLAPIGVAMDMLLSGERLTAEDAFRLGIVQSLHAPEALLDAALKKADMIAANSPTAVWGAKKVLKFWRDAMLAEQQRYYEAVAHRVFLSGDLKEGPKAFAEKRKPSFSDGWPDLNDGR